MEDAESQCSEDGGGATVLGSTLAADIATHNVEAVVLDKQYSSCLSTTLPS